MAKEWTRGNGSSLTKISRGSGSLKKMMKKMKTVIPILICIGIGGVCGAMIGKYMDAVWEGEDIGTILFSSAVVLVMLYAAIFLQIIIHEGGHLIFGLLTGYRYSSFRIGSFMWVKRDGKICFSRFSLAGTGGQCLLVPPDMADGKYPYVLYNMGGSIANLLTAAFFACLAAVFPQKNVIFAFFVIMAVIGVVSALTNGVPMRLGTVDNDGYNAYSIGKNPGALRAFWIQMMANQKILEGVRLREMPGEWFAMPTDEEMKNSMVAVLGVFACNRLMDEQRFEEADREMERLLAMDTGIAGLHKSLLKADRMFCEMTEQNRKEQLDILLDKQQKKVMKAMKNYPAVLRTRYAYALLVENDRTKAEQLKEKFEKEARKYPYPNEIKAERELMAYADSVKGTA